MKDILTAHFMVQMIRTIDNMYSKGWDERNGGNISMLLSESEIEPYLDLANVIRTISVGFEAKELAGKYFLVTGTGKYFKNVKYQPEKDLGIFRLAQDGCTAELIWGFCDGGSFTSECTLSQMIDMCIPFEIECGDCKTEEEARNKLKAMLPLLKRWKVE